MNWSGASRKLGERERSGERTFQKTLERSVEREAADRRASVTQRFERWAADRLHMLSNFVRYGYRTKVLNTGILKV